jgi:hypothetical protein
VLTPLSFRAAPIEGREGAETMKGKSRNLAARTRDQLTRDRGSRQLSHAIDARRRLSARRVDGPGIKADPFSPSDPRYAYLIRAYD